MSVPEPSKILESRMEKQSPENGEQATAYPTLYKDYHLQ
jgi:hypothetical protein